MSCSYQMHVILMGYDPARVERIQEAASQEWPFDEWQLTEEQLDGYGEGSLGGGEHERDSVDRLAVAIWRANGACCDVEVHATYLDELPYADYVRDEDDYARLRDATLKPCKPRERSESPQPKAGSQAHVYNLAVDGPLLRAQRERLFELLDAIRHGTPRQLAPADEALLEGLVGLTDAIADQAADRYGIDCIVQGSDDPPREPVEPAAVVLAVDPAVDPEDRLSGLIAELGLTHEQVARVVRDVALETAADVNHGELPAQIKYLLAELGEEQTAESLRVLQEAPRKSPQPASPPRFVLYDLDTDALASTTIYASREEAVEDAAELNDVIVVALPTGAIPAARDPAEEDAPE